MPRVQGEGNYEAARRYRARAEGFVRSANERAISRAARAVNPPKGLSAAEKAVRKRAKHAEQDRRDAAVFKERSTVPGRSKRSR